MILRPVLLPVLRQPANQLASAVRNLLAELLGSSNLFAPLTHSLELARGTGTPTFTRATTGTVQDNEGILRTAIAGEARFTGARMVQNLFALGSENFTGAAWTKSNGSFTGNVFTATAGGGSFYQAATVPIGKFILSCKLSCSTGTVAGKLFANGAGVSPNPTEGSALTITTTPTQYSVVITTTAAGTINAGLSPYTPLADGSVITVSEMMLENITGRTDQTTPSEYVSVGVLSAPYHGSGVDGVKYFDTDLSGNPIAASTLKGYLAEPAATNLCLQSNAFTTTWTASGSPTITKNVVGPDGATSAWTLTDGTGGADHIISGNITFTAAAYTASVFIKKTVGATTFPVLWMIDAGSTTVSLCTADTNNGVATVWTANGFGLAMMAGASARCSSYNDNYWRFELTATGTAVAYNFRFGPALTTTANQSSGTLSAATTGSAVFYGAQVELGSSATSYIPTTTTAVARNADVLTYTGGDISNIKTLACTFQREAGVSSAGIMAALSDGTLNNYEDSWFETGTTVRFSGVAGAAVQWASAASPYTAGDESKAAWSAATNDIKMDVDGAAVASDTSATVPTVTQINVGHVAGSFQLNGNVGGIYGWTRNLSQSELGAVDR